jgi:hypothetical protein
MTDVAMSNLLCSGVGAEHGADRGVVPEGGEDLLDAGPGQVTVEGRGPASRPGGGEHVVQGHAGADVGALPHPVLERVQEGDGLHEVGRELGEQEVPLGEGLVGEVEVEHLQVAQAAVDELRGAARGPARPVLGLHDPDAQAARRGVEGDAGPGDATADHEDVEPGRVAHLGQGLVPGLRGHDGRRHADPP